MAVSPTDIQTLRQQTGVGLMDAKCALEATDGNLTKAVDHLRRAGRKVAAAKSERAVTEGVIGTYIHANHKVGALVALACETDFVARTDDFRQLAHDLAMHVAALNPQYLKPDDVPAEIVTKEEDIYRAQLKAEGKPAKMWDAIIAGKLKKFYAEVCFLEQPFVKDDSKAVGQLIVEAVARLGENIQVTAFSRLHV